MEIITTRNSSDSTALQKSQSVSPNIQRISELYPTFAAFSQKFCPDNWEKGSKQPTKCVECNSPTLTDISLVYGNGCSIAWMMAELAVFQEKLNVPNKMSKFEIETCAQTIFDTYHHLKATEMMLFFARLLGGMYPVEWHGYVTPTKIVSALREYFMPWRNDLLYKIEKQKEQKRIEEEARKPGVTWEEFCKSTGRDPDDNPINRIKNIK